MWCPPISRRVGGQWVGAPPISEVLGGQLPLDARLAGYDGAAVLDYLRALDDGGRGVYLLEMRWLDAAFMASFALSLGLGLQILARGRGRLLRAAPAQCRPAPSARRPGDRKS